MSVKFNPRVQLNKTTRLDQYGFRNVHEKLVQNNARNHTAIKQIRTGPNGTDVLAINISEGFHPADRHVFLSLLKASNAIPTSGSLAPNDVERVPIGKGYDFILRDTNGKLAMISSDDKTASLKAWVNGKPGDKLIIETRHAGKTLSIDGIEI